MFDELAHHNIHTEMLLKLYPDLQVHVDGKVVNYYAKSVNSLIDEVYFTRESMHIISVNMHWAHPVKKTSIKCSKCDGLLEVNSLPYKMPIFIEKETSWHKEYILYACNYEEILKNNNFSSSALSKIQMYILNFLEEKRKAQAFVNIDYLNNSIKNLLPFT